MVLSGFRYIYIYLCVYHFGFEMGGLFGGENVFFFFVACIIGSYSTHFFFFPADIYGRLPGKKNKQKQKQKQKNEKKKSLRKKCRTRNKCKNPNSWLFFPPKSNKCGLTCCMGALT